MQVVKLCDLGIDDSVSSVGWAQRGTHLAVGTSNGKVQVRFANCMTYILMLILKETVCICERHMITPH